MKRKWIVVGLVAPCMIIGVKFFAAWFQLQSDVEARIQDEFDVRVLIKIEDEPAIPPGDWLNVDEFLDSLDGIEDDRIDQIRTLVDSGTPIEIDLRYTEDGIQHSFRLWVRDGRMLRHFKKRSGSFLEDQTVFSEADERVMIDRKEM